MISLSAFKIGLVTLAGAAGLVYLAFTKDIPFVGDPYEVRAAFADSSGLQPGSPVRIAGVDVGEVTEVEHTSPGARTVTATLSIRDAGRPLHVDARAAIRPRIFLEGNFFVDLEPGSPRAPALEEGGLIPLAQTRNPVQVGEVLRLLRRPTRQDLKTLLASLAEAQEAGAGRAFNRTLAVQGPAYRYSAQVADALLGERDGDLSRWLRAQGVVSAALDRDPEQLKRLITSFRITVEATADRERDLRAAVAALAPALEDGLPAFASLNDSFPAVRRLARAARPAVRSSRPTVRALIPLARQLRGLVAEDELRGVAEDLRRLTPPAVELTRSSVPLLEEARELAGCANEVLVPWGNLRVPDPNFPASGPVHEELPKTFPALAGESRTFDANGQWFRVLGTGGAETFDLGNNVFGTLADPIVGVNPPPDRTRPPLRPDVPCETQQPPDLRTRQGEPPRRVENDPSTPAARSRVRRARAIASAVLEAQRRAAAKGGAG